MNNISILDCTLRDGGYINNFNFGKRAIKNIIAKLVESSINIIECGFLRSGYSDSDKTLFNSVETIQQYIYPKNKNLLYVAMIAFGDISNDEIKPNQGESIDGIRITFHQHEVNDAFVLGRQLKDKGYKVFMQPVGTITYSDMELLELIKQINALKPYSFYLVDTLGTMYKNDLLRLFYLVDNNLDKGIAIGFHSHNNLQLSFSNAQELINIHTNRQIIIDSSVFGMGRGAGNLCTELITRYINDNIEFRYEVIPLIEIVDEYLNNIFSITPWGYSVPYYVASVCNCHPNYASYLLNKQTITVKSINLILNQIPQDERVLFNKSLIEKLYQKYQDEFVADKEVLNELIKILNNKSILLLAPGKSVETYKDKISTYIKDYDPVIIAINFIHDTFIPNILFISNLKRFKEISELENISDSINIITTSNINSKFDKVNYSDLINTEFTESDNAGIMCLRLLYKIGLHTISIAGFDGFSKNVFENYIDQHYINNVDSIALEEKTLNIKAQIIELKSKMMINFITPSFYV